MRDKGKKRRKVIRESTYSKSKRKIVKRERHCYKGKKHKLEKIVPGYINDKMKCQKMSASTSVIRSKITTD